jgi:protein-disulfide isomerase
MLANIAKDSNGTVNVQWRHLPAHGPDPLLHAVSLADAARFWPFATQVMTKFSSGSNPAKWTWDDIVAMGKAAGLTEEQLAKARDDEANWETLRQDYLAAKLLHIDKTPGLFYDGYFLTPDGLPLDTASFDKSLRAMVKVAGPKPK